MVAGAGVGEENRMNTTLVIVHVIASVVETVLRLRRHPEETEDMFLDRAIERAKAIVANSTPSGFDKETDSCDIFAIDEKTGEGTTVWGMDERSEEA